MPDISQHTRPTVDAIYRHYEATRKDEHRPHLGASLIGDECARKLWYTFRWAWRPSFDGRMLRLFDYGWKAEDRFVAELRAVGVTVLDVDPDTGEQWRFTAFGGHFGASLDGAAVGLLERPDHWHVLEFKTANDKNFGRLRSKGVQEAQLRHYAQMQVGMELSGMDRAFYLAENKNTSELHSERVRRNPAEASRLLDKAERIIFAGQAPAGISEDPAWYQCKFCDMHTICHGATAPEANCRTCLHSTPERNGTWTCAKWGKVLSVDEQRVGCDAHLYIPGLLGEPVDATEDSVQYDWGSNGPRAADSFPSRELEGQDLAALPLPEGLARARVEMGGVLE
jgi:hypothetical protein